MARVNRTGMRQQVYEIIKEKILTQEYELGEPINIVALCGELSVSNTPVREALSLLEAEGLVTSALNCKMRVIELTEEIYTELNQTIRALLIGAYDLCAESAGNGRLAKLMEAALARQEQALKNKDYFGFIQSAIEFDRSFLTISENRRLQDIFDSQGNVLFLAIRYNHQRPTPNREENINEHRQILQAVIDCRHRDVAALIRQHYNKHMELE